MAANISALYKKDDETDKLNYRPISLLSVSGKLMKSKVASTIVTHVAGQGLRNPHQWPCEKGHSTELLLVKITDDGCSARNMSKAKFSLTFEKRLTRVSTPFY